MATTSATIAAVYGGQDDGAEWLVSLASADERACSFSQTQTCADDAIARCAAVVKDAEAHVYKRGLAVLALGRTLSRELGRTQSRDSVSVGALRQVCLVGGWSRVVIHFHKFKFDARIYTHVPGTMYSYSYSYPYSSVVN